jgi:hypothetical protein
MLPPSECCWGDGSPLTVFDHWLLAGKNGKPFVRHVNLSAQQLQLPIVRGFTGDIYRLSFDADSIVRQITMIMASLVVWVGSRRAQHSSATGAAGLMPAHMREVWTRVSAGHRTVGLGEISREVRNAAKTAPMIINGFSVFDDRSKITTPETSRLMRYDDRQRERLPAETVFSVITGEPFVSEHWMLQGRDVRRLGTECTANGSSRSADFSTVATAQSELSWSEWIEWRLRRVYILILKVI